MKKFNFVILVVLLFGITGCTIDISKYKTDSFDDDVNEIIESEDEIVSVGVESDLENPLNIGDYGIASKYNVYLSDYKEVDVKLKNIIEDPDTIVNEYNLSNPNKLITKQDDFKYVVLEYEVILVDYETETFGDNIRLDVLVVDENDNSFIVDGVKQDIEISILEEDLGIFNGGKGSVKIAFAIPEDTVNYLVKFGTYGHIIAYYKV